MNETIEARLIQLEDRETARSVVQRYSQLIDATDLEATGELFADDAELLSPLGDFSGNEAIKGFFDSAWKADPSTKRHFITNQQVANVAPSRVRVESVFMYVGRGQSDSIIGWGSYVHEVDTSNSPAKIRRLEIGIDVGTTLAQGWAVEQGE